MIFKESFGIWKSSRGMGVDQYPNAQFWKKNFKCGICTFEIKV